MSIKNIINIGVLRSPPLPAPLRVYKSQTDFTSPHHAFSRFYVIFANLYTFSLRVVNDNIIVMRNNNLEKVFTKFASAGSSSSITNNI